MDTTTSLSSANNHHKPFHTAEYHTRKVVAERILGIVLLILAAPAIGLIVLIVRCTSAGTGIYKQTRVGKAGQEFSMYKIRTMYADAETCGCPQWSMPGDHRITPVGRVLRFLHLDELPQLANVARGQMSLIGPRPERPAFVAKLKQTVPNYLDRLVVLPGVTGLAQINLPADDSLESVRQKVVLDRHYIESATLMLDLRIFCCTLLRMAGLHRGIAPWLLGVDCSPHDILKGKEGGAGTLELTPPLDDSAINIPALIAAPALAGTASIEATHEEREFAYAAETVPATTRSDHGNQAASFSPRRPR